MIDAATEFFERRLRLDLLRTHQVAAVECPEDLLCFESMDEALRDLGLVPTFPREKVIQLRAQGVALVAACDSALASAPEPAGVVEDAWLEPDKVCAQYPIGRRWLFENATRLPFVKRKSPRKILVSEQGLKRWLAGRNKH